MTKQLPTNNIANELSGSSVFFQPQATTKPEARTPKADRRPTPATHTVEVVPSPETPDTQPSHQDVTLPRHRAITQSNHQDGKQPFIDRFLE